MTATEPDGPPPEPRPDGAHDDDSLTELGYRPELERTLGNFHTFAAGISYISLLTGTFQLFYFGVAHGGPAYWWSWPMVFTGQLMVALCFAELAGRYPVAGSVYNWSKLLGGPHVGWLGGWMMMTASMVSPAAVALAYQVTLEQVSAWFQVIGDGSTGTERAANAVLLGSVLVLFTTLVNGFGVKLMARINSAGVAIELIATVVLILLLAANITRGPSVALDTLGRGQGESLGYLGAFLTASLASAYVSLASAYVMYGFDTASSLGEESLDPGRNAPRAILRALVASFALGGLILLFFAYLMVTLPMLVRRLRSQWRPAEGRFSLGRLGLTVNALAVLWGTAMTVNLAWPRAQVYNATGPQHWYLRWGAVLFVGAIALGGFTSYWFVQRARTGVLAEHAAATAP
ncbi:APC family permease [Streptomyces sp. RCU064]|uniref:APC family permease n=1 Tax=Streptomyces rugosispiralis TaxID=2967341 RepID=A0ABT1V6H5_9ACTN|nr:APC family permease [Streptomyces rugosispiralis]MCQ8192980.1 APC family permease [Streptomyces rugosispiralis]